MILNFDFKYYYSVLKWSRWHPTVLMIVGTASIADCFARHCQPGCPSCLSARPAEDLRVVSVVFSVDVCGAPSWIAIQLEHSVPMMSQYIYDFCSWFFNHAPVVMSRLFHIQYHESAWPFSVKAARTAGKRCKECARLRSGFAIWVP